MCSKKLGNPKIGRPGKWKHIPTFQRSIPVSFCPIPVRIPWPCCHWSPLKQTHFNYPFQGKRKKEKRSKDNDGKEGETKHEPWFWSDPTGATGGGPGSGLLFQGQGGQGEERPQGARLSGSLGSSGVLFGGRAHFIAYAILFSWRAPTQRCLDPGAFLGTFDSLKIHMGVLF